jgi:hypothetical protein
MVNLWQRSADRARASSLVQERGQAVAAHAVPNRLRHTHPTVNFRTDPTALSERPRAEAAPGRPGRSGSAEQTRWLDVARTTIGGSRDRIRVNPGDTLWKLVSERLQSLGHDTSASAVRQGIGLVAQANGIADPDRIFASNVLDLSALRRRPAAAASALPTALRPPAAREQTPTPQDEAAAPTEGASLLDATLARAVRKGFLPANDFERVRDRIHGMAQAHGFAPDDLAEVALMESDGFNPRASNGRCFGILQFCEGEGRGADSVGMRGRASEIASRSVWDQLGLVERYLTDVGVGAKAAPTTLDDLYLAVLMPAARAESDPRAPLDIPGRQARALHPEGDRSRPITRLSIVEGLRAHAQQALAQDGPQRQLAAEGGNRAAAGRQILAAMAAYRDTASGAAQTADGLWVR